VDTEEDVDTGDTGLASCGLWAGVRLLLTGETAEQLKGCYIPVGTTFYFTYEEDSGMDPTVAPTPEPAFTGALPVPPVEPVAPTPVVEPIVQAPAPTATELGDMAQKVDDPALVVTLAIIALLGVGLWKHLGKVADQKAALDMKRLEIEADSVKRTPKAQPPPCQAANTALEAKISALEARLGKVESSSPLALPAGFDAEELDERVRKLEIERIKKD
jgi:hypothetical protein